MHIFKINVVAILLVCSLAFVGCGTMARAMLAQKEVASSVDAKFAPACENDAGFVDLSGLSLAGYVDFALSNRPEVVSSRLALSNAWFNLRMVLSDEYPVLNFVGGYSQSTHNSGPHFSWRQHGGKADAAFHLELLICDFGRIEAAALEACENITSAARELAETELMVFDEVTKCYFTLRQSDALLEVASTNETQFADHSRRAEALYSAGEAKKLDVLKARLDLSGARLSTISSSNDVVIAGANFIRSLGLDAAITERWDVLMPAENCLRAEKIELVPTSFNVSEAMELARTNSPGLLACAARVRAASARVDYAIADLFPSLSLSTDFSYLDPVWNFSWGISVLQTIFLPKERKLTAVDIAMVDMYLAREDLFKAEQQLSCELANAIAARDTAAQALANAKVQVLQAEENLSNVTAQYRVGEASRIDFTDAANAYSSALGARVKAFYSAQIAESALVRLMGIGVTYE